MQRKWKIRKIWNYEEEFYNFQYKWKNIHLYFNSILKIITQFLLVKIQITYCKKIFISNRENVLYQTEGKIREKCFKYSRTDKVF